MILGPPKLNLTHRYVIRRRVYKKVLSRYKNESIDWNNKQLFDLKRNIRLVLREQQEGRCIFCRRIILIERRNAYEDIEHFLDKSKRHYRKWSFAPVNLSIACHACNLVKSTRDMGTAAIHGSISYPDTPGNFRWIHPYFDDYHANIELSKGWIYQVRANAPSPIPAQRMIEECGLKDIGNIHAYAESIKKRIHRLTVLAGRTVLRNPTRAAKLIETSRKLQEESWPDY